MRNGAYPLNQPSVGYTTTYNNRKSVRFCSESAISRVLQYGAYSLFLFFGVIFEGFRGYFLGKCRVNAKLMPCNNRKNQRWFMADLTANDQLAQSGKHRKTACARARVCTRMCACNVTRHVTC